MRHPEGTVAQERFYEQAREIEARQTAADAKGIFQRTRLLLVEGEKYPLIRVEETVQVDPTGRAAPHVLTRVAMVADHVMVKLPPGLDQSVAETLAAQYGARIRSHLRGTQIYLFSVDQPHLETVPELLSKLQGGSIEHSEPDWIVHAAEVEKFPGDPSFSTLWGMHNTGQTAGTPDADIDAPAAWALYTGSPNVVVGVIDTGIDHTHPDLAANIFVNPLEIPGNGLDDDNNGYRDDVRGWNFVSDKADAKDDHYHGTHCAGTIGAVAQNVVGVAGVAWQVRLMPLKFLSASGSGNTSDAIEAVAYATTMKVALTSNSWGGGGYSELLRETIAQAGSQNILFVASAGNNGANSDVSPSYPAAYDVANIISVAASDSKDLLAYFSNYGKTSVDLAAPGVDINSTRPANTYGLLSGTSMAGPHVAGACALVKGLLPTSPIVEIKERVLATVDPKPAFINTVSGGRLNLHRLISDVSGPVLLLDNLAISDDPAAGATGNADGIANPGETLQLSMTLTSVGSEASSGIAATLSLSEVPPGVTLQQAESTYPDIALGDSATGLVPFTLALDPGITTPLPVKLHFTITATGGRVWHYDREFTVYRRYQVTGQVLSLVHGGPLDDATVSAAGPLSISTTTDPGGDYTLNLVDGTHSLTAAAPGYQSSTPQLVTVPPDTSGVNFALGQSQFSVTPGSLEVTLNSGQGTTRNLQIHNAGSAPLLYTVKFDVELDAAVQAAPGSLFRDDFESGGLANWTKEGSGTYEVVSNIPAAQGLCSFYSKQAAAVGHANRIFHDLPGGAQPRNIYFNVRLASTTAAAGYCLIRNAQGLDCIWFYANSSGFLYVNGSSGGSQDLPYEVNRWYAIEFRNIDWAAKIFDFYVDGVLVKAAIPMRNSAVTTSAASIDFHNFTPNSEAWWDNVIISDSPNFWLSATPTSGVVPAGGSQSMQVTFNANELEEGDYEGELQFQTNAPAQPEAVVSALLHVQGVPNAPPLADPQTITIDEDAETLITLTGSDPDENNIRAQVTSLPAAGQLFQVMPNGAVGPEITAIPALVIHADRNVLFRPALNSSGSPYAEFNFTMHDGKVASSPALITIHVTSLPDAPLAKDDLVSRTIATPITAIDVLANDTDLDGDTLSLVAVTNGSRGSAEIVDGKINYTPSQGFTAGHDEFTYTVLDSGGQSAQARVEIHLGVLQAGNWVSLGGDMQHTGYYPSSLGSATLQQSWSRAFNASRMSPAAIAQDRVFLTTESTHVGNQEVYALDLQTGGDLWSRELDFPNRMGAPSWHDGVLYVMTAESSSYPNVMPRFLALNATTGEIQWSYTFSNQASSTELLTAAVNDDGVWVNGGYDLSLHGFGHDGILKFITPVDSYKDENSPALHPDGTVYTYDLINLNAYDPETSLLLRGWQNSGSSSTSYRHYPVLTRDRAFVWSGTKVFAYDLAKTTAIWTYDAGSLEIQSPPAYRWGRVYVTAGSKVLALDAETGALLQTYETNDLDANLQPIILDDALIVSGTSNCPTFIFDLATGALRQTITNGGALAVSDGALVISTSTAVYLYRPAVADNVVPIGTAQSVTTPEDTPAPVTLTGSDANGDPLRALIGTLPTKGDLYLTPDGVTLGAKVISPYTTTSDHTNRVIYVPRPDSTGADQFSFWMCDAVSRSTSLATVSITISTVSDLPVAVDDYVSTSRPRLLPALRVLANDVELDNGDLTVTAVTQGSHGAVSINSGAKTLSYLPGGTLASGVQDTFTYTIQDQDGNPSTASVTIAVGPELESAWPQYGKDAQHSWSSSSYLGTEPWVKLWDFFDSGVGGSNNWFVVADKQIHASRESSTKGRTMAISTVTGAKNWEITETGPSGMSWGNGKLYFRQNLDGHQITAVDALNGALFWRRQVYQYSETGTNKVGILLGGGRLYQAYSTKMYCLYEDDGAPVFTHIAPNSGWGTAYRDGVIYRCASGDFRALDAATGHTLWSLYLGSNLTYSTLTISDHYAVVASSSGVICINLETRSIAWSNVLAAIPDCAARDGWVYVAPTNGASQVRSYRLCDGVVGSTYTPGGSSAAVTSLIATPDTLIVSKPDKTVFFSLDTGVALQTLAYGGKCVLVGERLYIVENGILQAYGRTDNGNGKPTATPQTLTTAEDVPVAIALGGTDPEGQPLSRVIRSLPTKGTLYQTPDGVIQGLPITATETLVTNPDGKVIFQPVPEASGSNYASFTFAVGDGIDVSAPATVTIDVTTLPDLALAVDDYYQAARNAPFAGFMPLLNDYDGDGYAFTITSFTQPAQGTVTAAADGKMTYTPPPGNDPLTVIFNYTITDETGAPDTAQVTIDLLPQLGADWPQMGGGPGHTGESPLMLGATAFQAGWTASDISEFAAVAGGSTYSGYTSGGYYKRDAASGALYWRLNSLSGTSYYGHVAYASGRVFSSTVGSPAYALSLDAETGSVIWQSAITPVGSTYSTDIRPPTVADGYVFTNDGVYGTSLFGHSADTGAFLFQQPLSSTTSGSTAYADGVLYECVSNGEFNARHPATGAKLYTVDLKKPGLPWVEQAYPVTVRGRWAVVTAGSNGLFCIDTQAHTLAWADRQTFNGQAALANSLIYAIKPNGDVCAYVPSTGNIKRTIATGKTNLAQQPIVTPDTLIVSIRRTSNTSTYLYRLDNGQLLQTLNRSGVLSLVDRTLFIVSSSSIYHFYQPNAANSAPTVSPFTANGLEDQDLVITLPGSDANGDPLKTIVSTLPATGALYQTLDGATAAEKITVVPSIVKNPEGKVIFRPTPDNFGANYASLNFQKSDASTVSAQALVTVHIASVPDAPVAVNDLYWTVARQLLSPLTVLSNDYDVDGGPLTLVSFTQPPAGEVRLTNGVLSYMPPDALVPGQQETFTYIVRDSGGLQSTATVTVKIGVADTTEWSTYGGNLFRTSYQPGSYGYFPWSKLWSYPTPEVNQVIIQGSSLYLTPVGTGANGAAISLDALTGAFRWSTAITPANFVSAPVLAYGRLYFQASSATTGGSSYMYVLNPATGTQLYRSGIPADSNSFGPMTLSYFSMLIAMNGTGERVFQIETNGSNFFTGVTVSAHDGGAATLMTPGDRYFFTWTAGNLRKMAGPFPSSYGSLTPASGFSSVKGAPVVEGGNVYVVSSGEGGLHAIGATSFTKSWTVSGGFTGMPAAGNNRVFAYYGVNRIRSYVAANGVPLREYQLSSGSPTFVGQPILTDDVLFAATNDATYLFNIETGDHFSPIPAGAPMSMANGVLYLYNRTAGALEAYASTVTASITPAGASSDTPIEVTLGGPLNSTLYYSLNGDSPSLTRRGVPAGTVITVDRSAVLKVVALSNSGRTSPAIQAAFTITDSDKDGLPDWWELYHYGDLTSVDGSEDLDHDGFVTRDEFQTGTNPKQSDSYLSIHQFAFQAGGLEIQWQSVAGRSYVVEWSDSLGGWEAISPELRGTGNIMTFTASDTDASTGYCRLRVAE